MTLKRQKTIAFIPAVNIIITWIMAFRTARRNNVPSAERFKMRLITVALLAVVGAAGLKLLQLVPAGTAALVARGAFNYLLTVLFSWAAIFAQKKFGACDENSGDVVKSGAALRPMVRRLIWARRLLRTRVSLFLPRLRATKAPERFTLCAFSGSRRSFRL